MKVINEDIKNKTFKKVYLLYGDEPYLKKQYRDRIKENITGSDTMNFSYYEGDKLNVKEIIEMADTLPFFSEKRLIVIENSGFFKRSNEELATFISTLPDYLVLVFVEEAVDERNKLFKAVKKEGYVSLMNQQTESVLIKWIGKCFKEKEMMIEPAAIRLLLDKTGASMVLIKAEMDKIISYCGTRTKVNTADIEAICSTVTVSKIFDMITAIAVKRQQEALRLYYDLLAQKEPPMNILSLMVRQFNGILQVKEALAMGVNAYDIAKSMGVAPFIAQKYSSQAKNFSIKQLQLALKDLADVEEAVKTGKLDAKMAVELMIIKYSAKKVEMEYVG